MTDTGADAGEAPAKSGKGLLLGLVLALAGAGAGFYATYSGLLATGGKPGERPASTKRVEFVPIEPLTVSIGDPAGKRFLRFRAELEVEPGYGKDVAQMMPRVVDVLNTYLRSISMSDVEDPSSLLTLRSQMRRRIDLVVGGDRVNDLLIMEFVVN